jgi:hypothetical protein
MNFEQKGICRNHSMQKFILKINQIYIFTALRENLTDCFNTFNPEDIFLERIKNNKDIKFAYISFVNKIVHITMQKFLKWEEKHQCDIQSLVRDVFLPNRSNCLSKI